MFVFSEELSVSAIKWKAAYEIGIPELDRQHQKLVDLINGLYEVFCAHDTGLALVSLLDELVDYAVMHFNYEEALMDMCAYPSLEEHLKDHQRLSSWVLETRSRVLRTRAGLTGAELIFLRNWLIEHVAAEDQKMGRYLCTHAYGEQLASQPLRDTTSPVDTGR